MSRMSPELVVARNVPWCEEQDDSSFLGHLHERNVWDDAEYWLLEWAVVRLTRSARFDRELAWRLFRIFSHTFLVLGCHFDPADGFRVKNKSDDEVVDLRERVQLLFEGYFEGNEQRWTFEDDPKNPLLCEDEG
jgi:hypothetical protein